MLKINNKEYKVLTSDLKYVDATDNSKKDILFWYH